MDDTRVPNDPQPDAALIRSLQDFGKTINSRLGSGADSSIGRMHVLRTANCVTETAWLSSERWVLFDTGLKDAMVDLNTLALSESPPQHALRWAFKTLARFLIVEDDWQLACPTLLASGGVSGAAIVSGSTNAKLADACSVVQNYFILAHEFVHLAFAEGRLTEAAATHDADVTAAFASSEPTADTRAAVRSLLTYDVAEIVARRNGVDPADVALPSSGTGQLDAALQSLDAYSTHQRPAQLKEELLCDALATDLAIGAFRDTFDEPLLLLAMYCGFRNLQCVEIIRALAETLAAANRAGDTENDPGADTVSPEHTGAVWNAGWRLTAWRKWLPNSLLRTPGTGIWDMLRRVSRKYDQAIGNEILLALPSRLNDWLSGLGKLGPLPLTSDLVAHMILGECDSWTLTKVIERSGFNEDHNATRLASVFHERYLPRRHAAQMETVRRWLGVGEAPRHNESAPRGTDASGGRATVRDLARMFDDGVFMGATHMIIVCDTFDHTDFPEYVMPGQDVHRVEADAAQKPFQHVMEVYNLREDKLGQLRSGDRVFRY